jgi:phenylalanyl-tRNA synthetase beta chain
MPTILVQKSDLESLLGGPVEVPALARELESAKAEVKGYDPQTGELKIELNDTNRPDLWSPPGLARQLRIARSGTAPAYSFFLERERQGGPEIHVDPNLQDIRPFVAGFLARGAPLSEAGLKSLIQSQEKLAENYGRKRRAVAIGVYRAAQIKFPIAYRAGDPVHDRYVPLGSQASIPLAQVLAEHPKGQEYGHLLKGFARYPLLVDAAGEVLSMPPIVNSQGLGAVVAGDRELFVEVTGPDLRSLLLALNIAAVDLADRGFAIEPVTVAYPYDTPFGRRVRTPRDFSAPVAIGRDLLGQLLGETLSDAEVTAALKRSGYRAVSISVSKGAPITVTPPAYRDDLLHPVDVIEDVAIAHGYDRFTPILPAEFTVGRLSPEQTLARRLTEIMLGAGYQEVISNILTARELLVDRMGRLDGGSNLVEIENVMSSNYAVLRDGIVPSLLAVEAVSSKALYPHRMFEIGEGATRDATRNLGSRTLLILGALVAHPEATFSELHGILESLLYYLGLDYTLEPDDRSSCLPGRAGRIRIAGQDAGWIGELAPECLDRWGIAVPASAFELDLTVLLAANAG